MAGRATAIILALRNGGRLATLDAGVRSLLPANSPLQDAVCLVRE